MLFGTTDISDANRWSLFFATIVLLLIFAAAIVVGAIFLAPKRRDRVTKCPRCGVEPDFVDYRNRCPCCRCEYDAWGKVIHHAPPPPMNEFDLARFSPRGDMPDGGKGSAEFKAGGEVQD